MVVALVSFAVAVAAPCAPVEVPADGVTGVGVWAPAGTVTIEAGDGPVRVEACGEGRAKLVRRGGVVTVKTSGAPELHVLVPPSVGSVSVWHAEQGVTVRDVPARLAVVGSEGLVDVARVGALRVQSLAGDLVVDTVTGDLVVDGVEGGVRARAIGGAVTVDRVTGTVDLPPEVVAAAR